MKFSHFFVDRPIFASVLSIFILIVGGIAYLGLPVSEYPRVAPPTIVVTAAYPGASPSVISRTVATPLEQEVNGVENMLYMYSQSTSDGRMTLTITFKLGTNLDTAQVLVQNRVSAALPRLPEEVRRIGVTTRKQSSDMLMVIHLLSPNNSFDQLYISNYATLQIQDVLKRLDGVGDIVVFGAREYSMRIWLDPERLASLNMTAEDVIAALREQNVQVAGGVLGQPPLRNPRAFQTSIQLRGRLETPAQFGNIIVKRTSDGRVVRLSTVARIRLGARDYVTNSYLSGKPAVAMGIFQRPGSNALEAAEQLKSTIDRLSKSFPPGLEYRIIYNPTNFIAESVDELLLTIYEAIALVVFVVFLFLQRIRATIIPILAIPVSLIGTFAVMSAFGFSVNTLTLFGLVLAVGIVVDDAIVVVENIERHIKNGLSAKEAAHKTMSEVGGALISIALVLSAVFVPAAFLEGISGQFYRQFALTIAVATIISAFNSLTLSPAISALLFKPQKESGRFSKAWKKPVNWFFDRFNAGFEWLASRYARAVRGMCRASAVMLLIYGGLIAATVWAFTSVPTGLIPSQDRGYIITAIQLPEGASLARTDAVIKRAEKILLETPGVVQTATFVGFSGATFTNASNAGAIFAVLAPASERAGKGLTAQAVLANANRRLAAIQEAFIIVIPPPSIPGIGTGGGFKMMIQDQRGRGEAALQRAAFAMMIEANKLPQVRNAFTTYSTRTPQLYLEVDRVKAQMLNVPLSNLFSTLEIYLGSAFVNEFNLFNRTFRVIAQADGPHRLTRSDIARLKTRSANGAIVPLGSVVRFRTITGPDRVPRFNLYPAAEINGTAAPGVSSGAAIAAMEQLAARVLPDGLSFAWTELAFQEKQAGDTAIFVFLLSVLFVFLVLAAQYESWALPLAIILIVPMCLLSAIAGLMLRGVDNNILAQIGFIVLIGLASKNAILIVEFARQLEEQGKARLDAIIEACRLRLRPILMTSFAFILGVVPLLLASGAGSEMRQALGTAVFFGMLGVTLFGLLFTPVFYDVIRRMTGRGHAPEEAPKPA